MNVSGKKIIRFTLKALGMLVLFFGLGGAWAYWQWQSTPTYWQANTQFLEQTEQVQLEKLAQDAENRMVNVLSIRGNQQQELRLSVGQTNAWLRMRLPAWLAFQGIKLPKEVSGLMVHPEHGQPAVAFAYNRDGQERIVTLLFDVQLNPSGSMTVYLRGLRGGKLPLNAGWITEHLGSSRLARQAIELIQGKTFDPVFNHPVDPQRKVRVTAIEIQDQGFILKLSTISD